MFNVMKMKLHTYRRYIPTRQAERYDGTIKIECTNEKIQSVKMGMKEVERYDDQKGSEAFKYSEGNLMSAEQWLTNDYRNVQIDAKLNDHKLSMINKVMRKDGTLKNENDVECDGITRNDMTFEVLMMKIAMHHKTNVILMIPSTESVHILRMYIGNEFMGIMMFDYGEVRHTQKVLRYNALNVKSQDGVITRYYQCEFIPDMTEISFLTLGEPLSRQNYEGSDDTLMLNGVVTSYDYVNNSVSQLEFSVKVEGANDGSQNDVVPIVSRIGKKLNAYFNSTNFEGSITNSNMHFNSTVVKEKKIWSMIMSERFATHYNARLVPRPRPNMYYDDETIKRFFTNKGTSELVSDLMPTRFRMSQFQTYSNGGYDIANNTSLIRINEHDVIGDGHINNAVMNAVHWKVFVTSVQRTSVIVRCALISLRHSFLTTGESDDREVAMNDEIDVAVNEQMTLLEESSNHLADMGLELLIAYDAHMKPKNVIIRQRPIENIHVAMLCTDVYDINRDGRMNQYPTEMNGLREEPIPILEYYRNKRVAWMRNESDSEVCLSDFVQNIIASEISRVTAIVRNITIDHIRMSMKNAANARVIERLSDSKLLESYKMVPLHGIANRLLHESCIVVRKELFERITCSAYNGHYNCRLTMMFGYDPWIRDSLTIKKNVKHTKSTEEANATIQDALKWSNSFTLKCKGEHNTLERYDDGMIRLPCGMLLHSQHTSLNRHACVRKLMGININTTRIKIHGGYVCNICKTMYQNNIIALQCQDICTSI